MMYGREKSDLAIVVMKLSNEAGVPVEETVERRAGATGKAVQPRTLRTQRRASVHQGVGPRMARQCLAVTHSWWEPYAGKPHVRFCAGGGQ